MDAASERVSRSGVGGVNFRRRVCQQQETTGAGGQREDHGGARQNRHRELEADDDATRVQEWRRREKPCRDSQGPSAVTLRDEQSCGRGPWSANLPGADWPGAAATSGLRLARACSSPQACEEHPEPSHTTHNATTPSAHPGPQPAGSIVMDCKYCPCCVVAHCLSTHRRALFSRVAGLAPAHHPHHESMPLHPATRPGRLLQTNTARRTLPRASTARSTSPARPPPRAAEPPMLRHSSIDHRSIPSDLH